MNLLVSTDHGETDAVENLGEQRCEKMCKVRFKMSNMITIYNGGGTRSWPSGLYSRVLEMVASFAEEWTGVSAAELDPVARDGANVEKRKGMRTI
jgi:hypothetical protein